MSFTLAALIDRELILSLGGVLRYLEAMRIALLLWFLVTVPVYAQQGESGMGLLRSALSAQQHGDNPTAIKDYEQFLKLHPEMAEVRANLGVALVHEKQFDEAIAQYRLALSSMPNNAAIHKDLGLAYFKKGDMKDARNELKIAYAAESGNPQLAILLSDCDLRLGYAPEAVTMLTRMEAANASNTDFEYVLGTALIATGQRREGAERIEKVAHETNGASAYLLAGSTRMDMDDFAHARADLEAALRLNPNLPRVYILTGMARDMDGDADAAIPVLRKGLERNPNDFNGNLYLGAILYKDRDMKEAKIYLDHASQLKPTNPTAGYEMAMWDSTSGDYSQAAEILKALVKSNPDWLQPHIELATVYYRLHQPADGARERAIVAKLKAQQQLKGPPRIQQP